MTKNSEWGVMAYLTESKYGRNGQAVTKNNQTTTGDGNYQININQSTTNNIYGIYDTVGGLFEQISSYTADSTVNYGNSFASTDGTTNNKEESTEYATVYEMGEENYNTANYKISTNKVFGDGVTETSTKGRETGSWYSADSYFIGYDGKNIWPFLKRGGECIDVNAGTFYFDCSKGVADGKCSFRVCMCNS